MLVSACLSTLALCAFHVPILRITSGPSWDAGSGDVSLESEWLVVSGESSLKELYWYVAPVLLNSGNACESVEFSIVDQ